MRKLSYTLFILWVSFVCPSCHNLGKTDSQTLPTELFSDGDLAFRRGTGFMSRIVVAADKNGTYSHVEILKKMQGEWHVIHAVPGEPEFKGDPDRVKIEPLTRFFSPERAVCGEIVRWGKDSLAAARAAQTALLMAQRGILFDHDYNLSDSSQMYCTELIEFAYRKEGIDLSEGRITHIDLPVVRGTYLLPSDLLLNKHLKTIYDFP